ncbi:hypothetical protein BpHYR1_040236 [Brachionus plicatilis]|uniref:Uncharacterized protein n=1 Tax=Brachionus plicatilis TaxID=10195 RepID=A0A3M7QG56_BRAPC|nr:hypothetical protein BpHYR1_040236 [Brachionus plicatilis]
MVQMVCLYLMIIQLRVLLLILLYLMNHWVIISNYNLSEPDYSNNWYINLNNPAATKAIFGLDNNHRCPSLFSFI